jgi:hypothetical protein
MRRHECCLAKCQGYRETAGIQSIDLTPYSLAEDLDRSHALRGNAAHDAPHHRMDAERLGMHTHAECGHDQTLE